MSASAKLVCVICQAELIQKTTTSNGRWDPYAINPCGHVFHRQCTVEWLDHNPTCPTCRKPVQNSRKLFFAEDEYPAESEDRSELEQEMQEEPWYSKFATPIMFGAGAVLGALVTAVFTSAAASKKEEKEDDRNK